MSEITSINGYQKLSSQLKVSMESTQKPVISEPSIEMQGIKQFEADLEKIGHAFTLVKEIRLSLESALRDLSPGN
jgi:hypothetical protein